MKKRQKTVLIFAAAIFLATACTEAIKVGDTVRKTSDSGKKTSSNQTQKDVSDIENLERSQAFIARNEDGISIYCPEEYSQVNPDYDLCYLETRYYYSKVCNRYKPLKVILPPHYNNRRKFPVMYVLHGFFGNENSMIGNKSSGNYIILSNMMRSGACEEMLIVFPNIYSSSEKNQCTGYDNPEDWDAYDNFVRELNEDIMPWMRGSYSLLDGPENTAVIGFSMGGRESLACGLAYPDKIGYIGAISPAPGLTPNQFQKGQLTERQLAFPKNAIPKLLMICVGDSDPVVRDAPLNYHSIFNRNGINHLWYTIPVCEHGDPAISSGIFNFAERVFR